jgi:dihydroorotate dehydrogenase (NAD+) catalytic subunit
MTAVGTVVRVGEVELPNPVMTASGTTGHGAELAAHLDLARLGAVVTKSQSAEPWAGNPAPRLHPTPLGMLNAVGLQGDGVVEWCRRDLPALTSLGARVVASIWGRSVDDYRRAAELLADVGEQIIAVEVNLSCPNLEGRRGIFAHDPQLSAEVMRATAVCGRPRWAKLSPNTDRIVEVAAAVQEAGAAAVTLVNTLLGLAVDPDTMRPALAVGGGGLSGRAIHPVAVRAVHDVHLALPDLAIVGVGGIASGWDAIEMMSVGAVAVQVGTAHFADPAASTRVLDEMITWAERHDVHHFSDLIGAAITRRA